MKHKFDTAYASILERLDEEKVMSIHPQVNGTFNVIEECDSHFFINLTREEMLRLSDEISWLVGESPEGLSIKEVELMKSLHAVLVKCGVLDKHALPTGPELIMIAETFTKAESK